MNARTEPFLAHSCCYRLSPFPDSYGTDDLSGRRILVQGLGNVGAALCHQLHEEGASLLVSDINRERVLHAMELFKCQGVEATEIFRYDCDVYAPCALGATLNEGTIPFLRTDVVVGAANNQLATEEAGRMLFERGVLYGPDYVVNSGGIINAAAEVSGLYDEKKSVRTKIAQIPILLGDIFSRSAAERVPTNEIADAMARARIGRNDI